MAIAARERNGVRQDRNEDAIHRKRDGFRAARKRRDDATAMNPGDRPRENGARADVIPREASERLAEPVEPLVENGLERLIGAISRRNPRAAGGHDRVGQILVANSRDDGAQLVGFVANDRLKGDRDAGRLETAPQETTGFVIGKRARITHRDDRSSEVGRGQGVNRLRPEG
jgi:hypothetical protein